MIDYYDEHEPIERNHDNRLRRLTRKEAERLVERGCDAFDWSEICVEKGFSPELIADCRFCGPVEICDGASVVNVGEISHYRAINLKPEKIKLINENGGRGVTPCAALNNTATYIYSKYRGDAEFISKMSEMAEEYNAGTKRHRVVIGKQAVVTNVRAICNTFIGDGAIVDNAEVIRCSMILSVLQMRSKVGAGVQIRNSIVGFGSDVDSAAQLNNVTTGLYAKISKAARVEHSYISDAANVSCCEISNSFVSPFHSQAHNNSFLISSFVGGQSNVAAGATIGSNHNSRANDGEIWAKRGFWPGLCTSLKHNSKFASFTMIAGGRYRSELNVLLPFSLVTIREADGHAAILPAYLLTHNMYFTMKSRRKFASRDDRGAFARAIELDPLAPDTVEEMLEAISVIENSRSEYYMERNRPATEIKNAEAACKAYKMMIRHYCAKNILPFMKANGIKTLGGLTDAIGKISNSRGKWINCSGAVMKENYLTKIMSHVKSGKIKKWTDLYAAFDKLEGGYGETKTKHALDCLTAVLGMPARKIGESEFRDFLKTVPNDCKIILSLTRSSRAKDYADPFRTMVYDSQEEMDAVLGRESDDPIVNSVAEEMSALSAMAKL